MYSLDGSWQFESGITRQLTVNLPSGHARFVDGAFSTHDAQLAEELIGQFHKIPGLSLSTRPRPAAAVTDPPAVEAQGTRPWWRFSRG